MGVFEKMRKIVSFLILVVLAVSVVLAATPEELAKINFKKAFELWMSGDAEDALKIIEDTLYKPIDLRDISKFWYLKARIEVDLGNVDDAIKDLKSVLLVDPSSVEVISYLKELEYLLGLRVPKKKLQTQFLFSIKGKKGLDEFFYSLEDIAVWGDTVIGIDSANKRILFFRDGVLVDSLNLSFSPIFIRSSNSGVFYLAGSDGALYLMRDKKVSKIAEGMKNPILAGVDRSGRLWGVEAFNVFVYDGKKIKRFPLDQILIAADCEIVFNGIWILDVFNRRLALFDLKRKKIVEDIPLFVDIKDFEVTPLGDFIMLSKDGKIFILKDKRELIDTGITVKYANVIRYSFPYLFISDWKRHELSIYAVYMGSPVIVKIDSLKYDATNNLLEIKFRAETLFGDPIHLLNLMTFAVIDGSKVQFKLAFAPTQVSLYKSDMGFITDKLSLIKRGTGYDVVIPTNSFGNKRHIIPLRDKSVRIFVSGDPENDDLFFLAQMSGGDVDSNGPLFPSRVFWIAHVPYTPGFILKITPISIYVVVFNEIFSDTVYMVEGGISGER